MRISDWSSDVCSSDLTVVETIDVDRKHHRTLIGGSGANIRSIVTNAGGPDNARELARMVRFPRAESDESTIRVEGPKSVVEKRTEERRVGKEGVSTCRSWW